jgi:hypothetical protein
MKSISSICWYLCGLFLVALLANSVMTVAPGGERVLAGMMTFNGFCSVLFAILARVFRRGAPSQPNWMLRVFQGIAVVATVLVLLVCIG